MILLNHKLTLSSAPSEDEDLSPSDDAVRQALLRMGGSNGGSPRRGGDQMSPSGATADSRRRRFSQNENVPVEYVSRDRPGERLTARHDAGEGSDPVASLTRTLERERQLRETAERTLQETKSALQATQTRLGHLELALEEARRAAREAAAAPIPLPVPAFVAPVAAEPEATEGAPASATVAAPALDVVVEAPRPTRGRGRPRLTPRVEVAPEDEPEPVKWWIRG